MFYILIKYGYCRNISWTVIYGPTKYGGLDFYSFYRKQEWRQIYIFIKYWRNNCQMNRILNIVLGGDVEKMKFLNIFFYFILFYKDYKQQYYKIFFYYNFLKFLIFDCFMVYFR